VRQNRGLQYRGKPREQSLFGKFGCQGKLPWLIVTNRFVFQAEDALNQLACLPMSSLCIGPIAAFV